MIDLSWTELSLGLAVLFFFSFLFFVVLFFNRMVLQLPIQKGKTNFWLLFISVLLIIFVSANSGSDWYHYQDWVWNYDFVIGSHNYGEPVYGYIIGFVHQNYLAFRVIVWGGAFLLSCLVFRRFNVSINVAVYFLTVVFLLRFNYARVTLAMSSYFLGLSFLIKPIKGRFVISILFMALFFWGAYEFHRSMLPVVLLTPLVFLPLDKPYIVGLLVVLLPSFAFLIKNNIAVIDLLNDDYITTRFGRYIEQEGGVSNLLGYIANVIMYGAFIFPIVVTTIAVSKHNKSIRICIKRLYRLTISLALFATSFLFMGLSSTVFFYRFLFMTFIPLTVLCVYLFQNKFMSKKMFAFIVCWGIISNLQPLFVGLYNLL